MSIKEQLENFSKNYDDTRAKYIGEARQMFDQALRSIFDSNPALNQITWTQYTPYFNDGDECIFGVGEVYFHENPVEPGDWDEGIEPTEDMLVLSKWMNKHDDILKEVFGDHVQVFVDKKENGKLVITVETYEHE